MKPKEKLITTFVIATISWAPLAPLASASDSLSNRATPPDLTKEQPVREWTLKNGHIARLRLVLVQDGNAVFLKDDIRQVSVSVDSLSDTDRKDALAFGQALDGLKTPVSEDEAPPGGKLERVHLKANLPHQPALEGRAVTVDGHIWKTFHAYYKGRLFMVESYNGHGRMHGPKIMYYPDGKVFRIYHFKGGVAEGQSVRFTENGVIHESFLYAGGQPMGARSYYKTGELRYFYPMVAGVRHGYSEHYFRSGELYARQHWSRGEEGGMEIFLDVSPQRFRMMEQHLKWVLLGTLWVTELGVDEGASLSSDSP